MNYRDIKELESLRQPGMGFSIESMQDQDRLYAENQLQRLGQAVEEWIARNEDSTSESGIYNSGHCFANDTFCLLAYDWNEGPEGPRNINFYHFPTGTDITWYKYWTRGTYGHNNHTLQSITMRTLQDIIDDCIESLEYTQDNDWVYIDRYY